MNAKTGKYEFFIILIMIFMTLPVSAADPVDKGTLPKGAGVNENTYIIGTEDVVYVHVWKEESLSRAVPVRSDGKISLPIIDDIQAEGLTPLQLKEVLIRKMKRYIDNPTLSVIILEANSFRVFVSGQVRAPGMFKLRAQTTLLQIIPIAGGFTEWADQKKITIIRKEKGSEKRITVNYKKLVEGDEKHSDIVLKSGDTIIVP